MKLYGSIFCNLITGTPSSMYSDLLKFEPNGPSTIADLGSITN